MTGCIFCDIVRGDTEASVVARTVTSVSFLDTHPLFLGHTLVVPVKHCETLSDLADVAPFFADVQRITRAVELGCHADGSFVAINNRVSQSVAHLHVHVVPRRKKDGLRGFFWPRQKYASDEARNAMRGAISAALKVD